MKKNVFFALFAIVALVFVGCEPPVEPVDYTVAISTTELTMELDGTQKLTAVVTPATTAYSILWTSDNEAVATVNASGIVTGVGVGSATITATLNIPEGDATVGAVTPATCVVNVTNDAAFETFVLGGYGLFGSPQMIDGTEQMIDLSIGATKCQLGYISMYAWDENVVFSNGKGFSGAGFFMMADLPVYWIVEGDYAGAYVGYADGFFIDTLVSEIEPYVAPAGQMIDLQMYGDAWKGILAATTEEESMQYQELYMQAHTGTQMFLLDFDSGSQSFHYANVSYLQLLEDDETGELYYDLKLEWYDVVNPGRFFGLACTEEEAEDGSITVTGIIEPYDLRVIQKEYNTMPVQDELEASAMLMPKNKNLYIGENPTLPINNLRSFHVR